MSVQPGQTGLDLHAVIARHRRASEQVYGVVDAGRDKELAFEGAARWGWKLEWLFGEDAMPSLRDVAPYLVPIVYRPGYPYRESGYLDLWADRLGGSAGILLLAEACADTVWTHLRSLFRQTDERGRVFYSRFYDPRVFRTQMAELSGEKVGKFFGPIGGILVEAAESGRVLVCRPGAEDVEVVEERLGGTGGRGARPPGRE